MFKKIFDWKATCALALFAASLAPAQHNTLTTEEEESGYTLLFNGENLEGWRSWNNTNPPNSWQAVPESTGATWNVLRIANTNPVQDLITSDTTFENFDIKIEFRLVSQGNSGLFIRYNNHGVEPWGASSGPETQIAASNNSDANFPDGKRGNGTAYEMFPLRPEAVGWDRLDGATNNFSHWQQLRVIAHGPRIAHFGNGIKLLEYEMLSEAWEAAFQSSKYSSDPRSMEGYRTFTPGSFYLQHHGGDGVGISFRNIRAKKLSADENPWAVGSPYLKSPAHPDSGLVDSLTFEDNLFPAVASITQNQARPEVRMTVHREANGINLVFAQKGDYRIQVNSLSGRTISRHHVRDTESFRLPANQIGSGTAIVSIQSGNGARVSKLVPVTP